LENVTYCEDGLDRRIAELEAELQQCRNTHKAPYFSAPLRRLFDSNLMPMCRASVNGALFDVNKAYEELTGYTKSELLELGWQAITPPEWLEGDAISVEQLRRFGRADAHEKEYIRKDGSRVSILALATAADAAAQDVTAFIINLTEIIDGDLKIKEREKQYRLLVDTIPQIVWIADSHRNIEYINNRFSDYTGLQPTECLQQAWASVIHPEDLPKVVELSQITNETGEDFELDVRHQHHDGTYHWSLCRSIPMKAPDGSIYKWIGTATDINEQKRIEQELRDRDMRFRMLADGIPQIVWTATNDGVIDFFNHRWLEYTGLTIEQSLDNGWHLLIHPSDLEQYKERWNNALKTGETYEFEFRLKRAVGFKKNSNGYRWHLCRAVPLRSSSGRIVKWFATWTEIHEQRKT
jgi:PAS domain S-box-containing protein